jgi:hypothetical protein
MMIEPAPIREYQAILHPHTVPTHLSGESVISIGTIDLSTRQVMLLLVGGSLAATLWERTGGLGEWLAPFGLIMHWALLVLLLVGVLLLTFGKAAGRSLDVWLLVLLLYLGRARILVWTRFTTVGTVEQRGQSDPHTPQEGVEDERKEA